MFSAPVAITCVYAYYVYVCDVYMQVCGCVHCIILYFVATCKRPFGPLLLNKMKMK